LSVVKTTNSNTPAVGGNVTFTITLSNASNLSAASGVTVTDVLPAGLTFVSSNPAQGTYNSSTGSWSVGSLASGSSTTLTVIATVATAGVKTNTAEVTAADEPDVNSTPNNHVPTEDDQSSVALTPPASVGDLVFWDLNRNGLQDAGETGVAGATVQLLQNGTVINSATTSSTGAYQFTGLTPGDYSLNFITPNGDKLTLATQGSNTAIDSDPNATTGATATFTLTAGQNDTTHDAGVLPVDLSVTKTVDNATPNIGARVTFTVTVLNASGWSNATNVVLNDVLPAGLAFVSATPAQGSFNSGTGVWTIGSLASGASTTMTIVATSTAATQRVNTARVTGVDQLNVDPDPEASATVRGARLSKAFFLGR
jgi:uncharacterized repeat protein (TIGR01451 family)